MMRLASVLVVGALILVLGLPRGAAAQQWPANGDFAQGGSPPAGWFRDSATDDKGDLRLIAAPPGISGQVLELRPNARNAPSDKPLAVGQLLPATVFRGREVEVSAAIAASGGAQAVVGLSVVRKGGAAGSLQLRTAEPTLALQRDRLQVPDDPAIVGLVLFLAVEGTAGSARFASVAVKALGSGPAVEKTGPTPTTSEIPASVRIDASRVLRTIPRGLFGTNVETIRDGNGLWDSATQSLQQQIVTLARDLDLSVIRFPGGGWSDAYDWRDGVGPPARRRPAPFYPGATELNHNTFGTDEALQFAKAVGGHLMITVNVASGTPQLAADWVRYINGEGGHSPRNGRVDIWEIGNEPYMAHDLVGASMPPERYADRVVAFAVAMRAVDPTIKIAAVGLRNFGRYRMNAYDDWNEVVLRRAGAAIDLFAVHDAYAPVVGDSAGFDPAEVYRALWAAPTLIAQNLRETWQDIERFAPDQQNHIRIAVTEWGPLFAVSPASPWIDHVKTLGSAVFVASMLKVFAEDPHVALANFFKLNEASFMGWIGKRGDRWVPTAPYYAFRMIAREMEPELLADTVDVTSYRSSAVGFVDGVSGVPDLDVLATASGDRSSVTALLINRNLTGPIAARVALTGVAGWASLASETLTGQAPDANTGSQLPQLAGLRWAPQKGFGPQGGLDPGGAGEVRLDRSVPENPRSEIVVRVPPHSLMLLHFKGVRR